MRLRNNPADRADESCLTETDHKSETRIRDDRKQSRCDDHLDKDLARMRHFDRTRR